MAIFSRMRPIFKTLNLNLRSKFLSVNLPNVTKSSGLIVPFRQMGSQRTMNVAPSRFLDKKFKDLLHFYFFIGLVPLGLLITLVNIYIGPAKLVETPEGYEPNYWEYYPHPIQRFFARYVYDNPQELYEMNMHALQQEHEQAQLRHLEKKVRALMDERNDYQAWFYAPISAKYYRKEREVFRKQMESLGE